MNIIQQKEERVMKLNKKIIILLLFYFTSILSAIDSETFFDDRKYRINYYINQSKSIVVILKNKRGHIATIKSHLPFLSKEYSIVEDIDNDGSMDNILVFLDSENSHDDFLIKVIYNNKVYSIEHFPSSLDFERYTKIDKNLYMLPKIIQKKITALLIKMKKNYFLINNNFKYEMEQKKGYLWGGNDYDYKPWGERGIYSLSEEETNKVLTKEVKSRIGLKEKKIGSLDYLESYLYKYIDKLGKHYLLIEKYKLKNSISEVIKVYGFLSNKKSSILEWSFRDFSINGESVYIHMDNNIEDINNDGIVEPIFYYRINSEVKVLIFYKGEKIIIRTQNIQNFLGNNKNIKLGQILVDKLLYELPQSIQQDVLERLKDMLRYDGGRFLNSKKAMNNKTLRIMADEKLIEQEQ